MTVQPDPLIDYAALDRAVKAARPGYADATPFPHAVLRDVVDPDVLRSIATEAQSAVDAGTVDVKEHAFGRKGAVGHNREWSGVTRQLFHEFNSARFVLALQTLTGIDGLIPDPHYLGGGLHMIPPGGFLGIHADFSRHDTLHVDRRLNMILYLNEDWDPSWGGALELWDRDMTAEVSRVQPELGTMIVFSTLSDAFHGHPEPLTCPNGRSRLSMATYYYTAGDHIPARRDHPTLWQSRDGSERPVLDWVPPALVRMAKRARRRLSRAGG